MSHDEMSDRSLSALARIAAKMTEQGAPVEGSPTCGRCVGVLGAIGSCDACIGDLDLLEALTVLRHAATDAYKAGRIPAEPFVRAGNAIVQANSRIAKLEVDLAAQVRRLGEEAGERIELRAALESVVSIAKEAHREWDADNDHRVGKILMALAGYRPGYRADIDAIHAALAAAQKGESRD